MSKKLTTKWFHYYYFTYLILSTCLIIILSELVYFIRLITKFSLQRAFYVHYNQIIDFKYYFNNVLKKIKII